MSVTEIAFRLILIVSSAGANLDGHINAWVSGGLGLVAMAVTIELAVRPYGKEVFDRLLLMAGSLVVAFIVLGLLLNFTPWGLSVGSWNVAWVFLSTLVLFWRRGSRTRVTLPRSYINVLSLSIVVGIAIIVGAGVLALDGARKSDAKPVLSFSVVSSTSTQITTEISGTSVSGRYSVVAISRTHKASRYTSKPFVLSAGHGRETIKQQVPVKVKGPWVIYLESATTGKVIRELIVDVN